MSSTGVSANDAPSDGRPCLPHPGQPIRLHEGDDYHFSVVWQHGDHMWAADVEDVNLPGGGEPVGMIDWQRARRIEQAAGSIHSTPSLPMPEDVLLPRVGQPVVTVSFNGVAWLGSDSDTLLFAPFAEDLVVEWARTSSAHLWFLDIDEDQVIKTLEACPVAVRASRGPCQH